MKKVLALALVIATLALVMVGCINPPETPKFNPNEKSEGTMTYEQYVAAKFDEAVVIEGFVQGKQSWWDNKATIYLQDGDGAYFVYEMTCSKEDYAKLTTGTKIKVTGYKTQYHGEIEVDSGAEFEIIEGANWVATPTDVTSLLGKEELVEKQNMLVSFKGMTVKSVSYKNWNPGDEGEPSDDIYVTLTKNGAEYDFCVEVYLTGTNTDVYKAVKALKEGDVIDVTGFLYWYDGPNPHITGVTVK